jgi:hypothetical protein
MQVPSNDVSFEQWLLRAATALSDSSLPGVLDLSQCSVLITRPRCSLTAEEVRQLKLALQSNSNLKVLKICVTTSRWDADFILLNINGLNEIAETLGKLTALQQLHLDCKIYIYLFFYFARGAVLRLRESDISAWSRCWA